MAPMRVRGIPEGLRSSAPAALQLAWAPLRDLSGAIGTITTDLKAIAAATRAMEESTRTIPALHDRLEAIEERVSSIDSEVARMRRGVDALEGEVGQLRGHIEPVTRLAGRFGRSGRGT
jgi:chromosome segregation ATPase